jgi:hypothetical protein
MLYRSVALVVVACSLACERNLVEQVQYSSAADLIHRDLAAFASSTFAQEFDVHIGVDVFNRNQESTHLFSHIMLSSVEYTVIVEVQKDFTISMRASWCGRHDSSMVCTNAGQYAGVKAGPCSFHRQSAGVKDGPPRQVVWGLLVLESKWLTHGSQMKPERSDIHLQIGCMIMSMLYNMYNASWEREP